MQVDFRNNLFVVSCSFDEREKPRAAGFKWSTKAGVWYTDSIKVAANLREHATPNAETKINERLIHFSPWIEPLPLSCDGLQDHQVRGAYFVLERSSSYLAFDPGLGKTAIAAITAQALFESEGGLFAAVYITPPFLVKNIEREFARWAPDIKTAVLNSKTSEQDFSRVQLLILPDTLVAAIWADFAVEAFVGDMPERFLIVDEAHRFKNETAQRTQFLLGWNRRKGIERYFSRKMSMSGTPMPNRPMELYTILHRFAPEVIGFRSRVEYGERYCAGTLTDMGWDFSGASNLDELRRAMVAPEGIYMLRARKEVLNLPPKVEQVFLLQKDLPPKIAPLDQSVSKSLNNDDTMREKLASLNGLDSEDMAQVSIYRRVLGEYKAHDILPFLKSILEETNEAIIVFAYHRQAIQTLVTGLKKYEPFVITGDTPTAKRMEIVDEFRENLRRRIIIANYIAAGVGLPLQRADRIVFVEFSWVPGENAQASDRPHRIGRHESVLVQYVTYQNSLDEAVLRTNLAKMKTISNI